MADRPEWQCGTWRGISDGYPFIVCPRGSKHPSAPKAAETFTFTSIDAAAREVRAALESLKARFGPYVASGKVVFAGYSLGANFGAFIVKQEPAFFARVAFIEGDARRWSASNAAIFARGGGERVLFVCAQASCVSGYEQAAALTERAGAEARFVDAKVGAHVFDGRVAAGLKKQFDWLVAGDKRWQSRGERR
jgi:predicted esterase